MKVSHQYKKHHWFIDGNKLFLSDIFEEEGCEEETLEFKGARDGDERNCEWFNLTHKETLKVEGKFTLIEQTGPFEDFIFKLSNDKKYNHGR